MITMNETYSRYASIICRYPLGDGIMLLNVEWTIRPSGDDKANPRVQIEKKYHVVCFYVTSDCWFTVNHCVIWSWLQTNASCSWNTKYCPCVYIYFEWYNLVRISKPNQRNEYIEGVIADHLKSAWTFHIDKSQARRDSASFMVNSRYEMINRTCIFPMT